MQDIRLSNIPGNSRITSFSLGKLGVMEMKKLADEKKKITKENVNTVLGGMGLYGTTGNIEVEGYEMAGDIENAGQLDKGFNNQKRNMEAKASLKDSP